jgi:predicted glutamine amidotransferase
MTDSADGGKAVLVVSEKLSDEKDWTLVPSNHFVIVDHALKVETRPIN